MLRLVKMYRYECGDSTYASLMDVLVDCIKMATLRQSTGGWSIRRTEVVALCDVVNIGGRRTFNFVFDKEIYGGHAEPASIFHNTDRMISKALRGELDGDVTHGVSKTMFYINHFTDYDEKGLSSLTLRLLPSKATLRHYIAEDDNDISNAELLDYDEEEDNKDGKL